MYPKSQNTQQKTLQHQTSIQTHHQQQHTMGSSRKDSRHDSHPKSQSQQLALKIVPSNGDINVNIATVTLANHPNTDILHLMDEEKKIQIDKRINPQSSKLSCCTKKPDPILAWDHHCEKQLYSEFLEFIEQKFNEVMIKPDIHKYYAKIGLQIFIFILNFLELIFTLFYKTYNGDLKDYQFCYILSIVSSAITHSASWMYSYKLRKVEKTNILQDSQYYIFYLFMGLLSFFKIAPFIIYFSRNESIKQFSFSEINKYLLLDGEDKFRNPLRLLKKRTKPVNMFRDFIFHRLSLLSMIITLCLQTLPQLFIQGFNNSKNSEWDGYNVVSFILLASNLIYYLLELYFIILTTTTRFMTTEIQFKLNKIK